MKIRSLASSLAHAVPAVLASFNTHVVVVVVVVIVVVVVVISLSVCLRVKTRGTFVLLSYHVKKKKNHAKSKADDYFW